MRCRGWTKFIEGIIYYNENCVCIDIMASYRSNFVHICWFLTELHSGYSVGLLCRLYHLCNSWYWPLVGDIVLSSSTLRTLVKNQISVTELKFLHVFKQPSNLKQYQELRSSSYRDSVFDFPCQKCVRSVVAHYRLLN